MSAAYDFTIGASLLREAVGHATIALSKTGSVLDHYQPLHCR